MLAVIVLVLALVSAPAYGVNVSEAAKFLQGTARPEVRALLSDAVRNNDSAVIEYKGFVYSLCAVEVRRDKSLSLQNALKSSALRQAEVKAEAGAAMYLDGGRLRPDMYENREAFNHVMTSSYKAKAKFRSASKIINWTAFSLVWCEKVNAPVSENEFNEKYSDTLYEWEGY